MAAIVVDGMRGMRDDVVVDKVRLYERQVVCLG